MAISNPYLQDQATAIQNQANNNLQLNTLPGLNAGAMQAGGFGGSRQGVAQGVATGLSQQGVSNALAGMYGNAYQADQANATQSGIAAMNNATQQQIAQGQLGLGYTQAANNYALGQGNLGLGYTQANQNYALGQGNLGLGYQNSNNNYNLGLGQLQNSNDSNWMSFYNQQRGLDQSGAQLGANLFGQGQTGLANQGTGQTAAGQAQFNAGYLPYQSYANLISPFSGLGGQQVTNTPTSNQVGNTLGGLLGGAQLGQLFTNSDARLKTNIRRIGTTARGYPAYAWDWKSGGSATGVIAQEVALTDPSAVRVGPDGFLQVDYAKV